MNRILVWDVPTRLFHWLLAASFVGAFLTGDSERYRDIHLLCGYTMLGLIAFRLVWGLIGTRYARFRSFLFAPTEVVAYLKSLLTRVPRHYLGHNPAGSIAIFLLLGFGVVSGITGYAAYNEIGGEWMAELHEGAANTMLALVLVHIAGVLVSSLRHRENLVRGMITGYKSGDPGSGIRHGYAWVGAIMLAAVTTWWTWYPQSAVDSLQAEGNSTAFEHHEADDEDHDSARG